MKENMSVINSKEKGNIPMKMEDIILENGKKDYEMEKE
jgi:hypothetical protein